MESKMDKTMTVVLKNYALLAHFRAKAVFHGIEKKAEMRIRNR